MNKKRIPELVIIPDQIKGSTFWGLKLEENMFTCQDCGSMIVYVQKILGVTANDLDYSIVGWRSMRDYRISEIGINLYCAKCGESIELYHNFCWQKDQVVCEYDALEGEEMVDIEYCLRQFNEKGDFVPRFKTGETKLLKEKLVEYEKKHPLKKLNKSGGSKK